jgi:hypothetical protein
MSVTRKGASLEKSVVRTAKLVVRYTAEEKAAARARAIASRCPLAVYVREASLGRTRRPTARNANAEIIRALASAGNALRGLARADHVASMPELVSEARNAISVVSDAIELIGASRARGMR